MHLYQAIVTSRSSTVLVGSISFSMGARPIEWSKLTRNFINIGQNNINHQNQKMLGKRFLSAVSYRFSYTDKMKKRLAEFLTVDTGGVLRNTPTTKERKYKNIEIAEDFKKIDQKRKRQRLQAMKARQNLIEQKISSEGKLLSAADTQLLENELKDIQSVLASAQKDIQVLTEKIEETQATHILIEGHLKLTVMNHIKYLEYLNKHNPGSSLHPETIKAIENIHYCVNHNLPVNRITLYEIMPDYFQAEIGELQQSIQKLIAEKNIFIEDEDSPSSIRFFHKLTIKANQQPGPHLLEEQMQHTFNNVGDYVGDLMMKHVDYLDKVHAGKTPFRNLEHMQTVLLSDLPINYLPEEEALRKDLLQVIEIKKQWEEYRQQMQKQIFDITFNYVDPPPYIANHPVLMDRWEKFMTNFTNPIDTRDTHGIFPEADPQVARFPEELRERIEKEVREKYDPLFVEAMNGDRSKIDKKKLQIQFYNTSTNIYQNLLALQGKTSQEEQIFKKLQTDVPKFFIQQRKKSLIQMDHLTRMIYLNNKDKNKYSLNFFSQWLGIEKQQLGCLLRTISYLQVTQQAIKQNASEPKFNILKFQM